MTIQPPADNAPTWRDLVDELTPEQVAKLTKFESASPGSADEVTELLLETARDHVRKNRNDKVLFGHLPAPVDKVDLWHWEKSDSGYWSREFTGTARKAGAVNVSITGVQRTNGSILRRANLYVDEGADPLLSPDELRAVAAELVAAADEMDALSAEGHPR